MLYPLLGLVVTRFGALVLHEGAHALTARLLGHSSSVTISIAGLSQTSVAGVGKDSLAAMLVRHAGWITSVAAAIAASCYDFALGPLTVLWLTAFDGVYTDLLGGVEAADTFFCGNFGLLLLDQAAAPLIKEMLEKSVRVTMMRGAQSAGLVTYVPDGKSSLGIRKRVVNGKRTDLCDLLMAKWGSKLSSGAVSSPQLFQGHTRFATSSIAALPGCHPHQWSTAAERNYWTADARSTFTSARVSHETFISHNGDLDFYEWHGVVYPLEDVFAILERVLHQKPSATVDSMGVAGLLDLLRTKGMWFQSVRYAYLVGGLTHAGNLTSDDVLPHMWSPATLDAIVGEFETQWRQVAGGATASTRQAMLDAMLAAAPKIDFKLPPKAAKVNDPEHGGESGVHLLVRAAVDAFFDQDLYAAAKELLAHAEGSFGLCLSTSVDAANEVVIAARGQTMSIAFWPKLGVLTWGSEAAATKTGLGKETGADRTGSAETEYMDGFRFECVPRQNTKRARDPKPTAAQCSSLASNSTRHRCGARVSQPGRCKWRARSLVLAIGQR